MDVIEIERVMTKWAADVLGLVIDRDVFRGGIPTGFETGIGVILSSEIRDNWPRPRTYNVQILGKFEDRDTAWRMLSKLAERLPVYGCTFEEYTFRVMEQVGSSEPYTVEENGRIKFYASFNMLVVVLTSGAQV